MIEALFCLVNRGHVVFDICRIHICNYLFQSPIFFLVINLRYENTYLHSTTYVNIMVQFFDKNHINPLGIYGQTRTTNEYMNFSTWNTIIFGIIWIVNVSVDYFRLKVFSRGPDPKREGLHKWGARGLKCHPFPPNSGDQLQPLVASSRGIPILSRIASAAQWAKTFFLLQRMKSSFIDIFMSRVASKQRPSNFFLEIHAFHDF